MSRYPVRLRTHEVIERYEFDLSTAERKCLELQKEHAQLKGEEPIPYAWWSECPKLAQKTMERIIAENENYRSQSKNL